MRDELVARRRDLHQHPELAFEEVRTAGIVARELTDLGLEVQTGRRQDRRGRHARRRARRSDRAGARRYGRAADSRGKRGRLRFDRPRQDARLRSRWAYDDCAGVAKLLAAHRDQIAGRVKFVFQPAEEVGKGAQAMVNDGVLSDPRPDVSVGLHLWNSMPVGELGVADGPVMAGASIFTIKITGKGSHAASPHQGVDPVVCAAQMVTAFQTIASRSVDPLDTVVLSVTTIHAGEAYNVIPQTAEMRGTVRYFKTEVRDLVFDADARNRRASRRGDALHRRIRV